ncbi:conserved hypothetical protein [Tenacibaculum maritimum]|uniref:DUF3164 family protein n=1 Tax=Tenacibaculum maritimum TaxID=107401 RepID=UPI0012E612C1|nr:DUF3164 family protein [Tenacibaculum maritimum]MCD9582312.1 DUF3164 family protein [Tenacibaculum maritimum]MCD9636694.1 DUF3164 family protein [Tenacibaculum maritimum]CAA0144812.1 conserved hypothetical protein [Tenacibaculum maritimum]CAA0192650.1 conserved hypothetical protein [Tenacibaculum maritimum]
MGLETLTDEEFQLEYDKRQEAAKTKRKEQKQAYESLKTDTILSLSKRALNISESLSAFKTDAFDEMQTLYKVLQEYSSRHADGKGNFSIESPDFKISYKRQGKATFDERSNQAEKHILDFLNTRYSGDQDTRDLITSLLERKNGDLDINLIQKLYQMEDRFNDDNWKHGISLLKESYQYCHSKDYIKFERKTQAGEWTPILLQFSKI